MNQPVLQSPQVQETWLPMLHGGLVNLPEEWLDELGIKNRSLVKVKKEDNRLIIEQQTKGKIPPPLPRPRTLTRQLVEFYKLKNPEAVWRFLATHQYLLPLLLEAHNQIREYFPEVDIVLEHVPNPEAPDDEQLVLYIGRGQDRKKDLEALDHLGKDWWLNALDRIHGVELCITVGAP